MLNGHWYLKINSFINFAALFHNLITSSGHVSIFYYRLIDAIDLINLKRIIQHQSIKEGDILTIIKVCQLVCLIEWKHTCVLYVLRYQF